MSPPRRTGEWEHAIVSNVSQFIPDSIKQAWHDWRAAMKAAQQGEKTGQETTEGEDAAATTGWGVEQAEQRNKTEASE
jgi:hypothetical protein